MCWAGAGLTAELPPQQTRVEIFSGWRFEAPQDTVIDNFTLYRYAEAESVWSWGRDYTSSYDDAPPRGLTSQNPDYCFSHFVGCIGAGVNGSVYAADNRVQRAGVNARSLTYQVVCWKYGDVTFTGYCDPGARTPGRLAIFASRFGLRDALAPAIDTQVRGPLADGRPASGLTEVSFSASDRGGGLASAWMLVDGKAHGGRQVASSEASCRTPYTEVVPCPRRAEITLPLDAAHLEDGPHTLQVLVADASGNEAASRTIDFTVANPPSTGGRAADANALVPSVTNGHNASRFVRLRSWFKGTSRRGYRTVAYGESTSIDGQLMTASGIPVIGATVSVEERVLGANSGAKPTARVTTDRTGRFSYRLPPGSSRVIRFSYRAFSRDPGPVAVAQATLHVRAGVSLRVSPTRVRNGSVIRFAGRVLGERGSRRAIVTIYALVGGPRPRVPVETVRAGADGRFVYRYRFRSIPGPSVYRFEARVPKQTGYPYSEGASGAVVVRGRP
jgi:hypothetical protein